MGLFNQKKVKYIETRSWKTNYRGKIYIHASLKKVPKKDERINNLISLLKDIKKLENPIPAKGSLGIWNYND